MMNDQQHDWCWVCCSRLSDEFQGFHFAPNVWGCPDMCVPGRAPLTGAGACPLPSPFCTLCARCCWPAQLRALLQASSLPSCYGAVQAIRIRVQAVETRPRASSCPCVLVRQKKAGPLTVSPRAVHAPCDMSCARLRPAAAGWPIQSLCRGPAAGRG